MMVVTDDVITGVVAQSDYRREQRTSNGGSIERIAGKVVGKATDTGFEARCQVDEYAAIHELEGIGRAQSAIVGGQGGQLPVQFGQDEQPDYGARAGRHRQRRVES